MRISLALAAALIAAALYIRFEPKDCEPLRVAHAFVAGGCDHSRGWR